MECLNPKKAWRVEGETTRNGKAVISFRDAPKGAEVFMMPCGKCMACAVNRSNDWSVRLTHEMGFHNHAWFLTLTYDDEHLPYAESLVPEHASKFVRALRDHFRGESIVRHFTVGEYGGQFGRPHYHSIIFGPDIQDREFFSKRNKDQACFKSPLIERLWGKGLHELSFASLATMGYVAKYVTGKVTNSEKPFANYFLVEETGELIEREPEFAHMSRRPGIGKAWFDKYARDVFPEDRVIHSGRKLRVPRYYDALLERENPESLELIKQARKERALQKDPIERTRGRTAAREAALKRRVQGGANIGKGRFRNKPGVSEVDLDKTVRLAK